MCKLPTPRICTTDETRETLAIWFDTSGNFFSGDDRFKRFLTPNQTWARNHAAGHYGFQQEPQASRLRRAPAEIEADLLRFFSAVSGFFPFTFLTRTFPETTSWATMKAMVYKTYNMELNGISFLTFNQIKRCPEENYYIFYERLLDHFRQHLVGPNIQAVGLDSGDGGDGFNLSTLNMVAMFWLERVDKRLLQIVKKEYATQLMAGTQLVALVPRIANDMETLLGKLTDLSVNRFQSGGGRGNGRNNPRYADDVVLNTSGFRGGGRGRNRSNRGRDRGDRRDGFRTPRALPNAQDLYRGSQFQCSHCKHLEREMRMRVPSDHSPLECQRRRIQVRMFQEDDEDQEHDYQGDDQDEQEEDFDENDYEEGLFRLGSDQQSHTLSLQSSRTECRGCQLAIPEEPSQIDCILLYPGNHGSIFSLLSTVSISDLSFSFFEKVNKILLSICSVIPTKSRAPRLLGDYQGRLFLSIVDSGADLNCLDYEFVREMNIPFQPTNAGVTAAGGSKVCLAGVTTHDFIFFIVVRGESVPVNAQRAVVVHNLGADSILGEPGKSYNDLETNARRRQISIRYEGRRLVFPYHNIDRDHFGVARVRESKTIYPGQTCSVPVPAELAAEEVLLYTPQRGSSGASDFAPGFYPNYGGVLSLVNTSETTFKVSRTKPIGDLRVCTYSKVRGKKSGKIGSQARNISGQIYTAKVSFPSLAEMDDEEFDEIKDTDESEDSSETDYSGQKKQNAYDWYGGDERGYQHGGEHDHGVRSGGSSSSVSSFHSKEGARQSSGSEKGYSNLSGNSGQTGKKSSAGGTTVSTSSDFRYRSFKTSEPTKTGKKPEIQLDPDKVMPRAAKEKMRSITNKFPRVIDNEPGKYNGYFGKVNNSIVFASTPTPNTKVHLPAYTEEMKRIQGDLMDQMMSSGVLVRPEDIGITPEVVCPSLLVPETEPGKFRLVTDFSKLNKHIRKCPSSSPTVAEAKGVLSAKKYFMQIDISNYFCQSGLDRVDSQYLATFHPFRGLLVYVVEPEGLKNVSEHGYEVLSRVYGDMCAEGKMTRIGDKLFPVGDTYEELAANYEETLRRADLSGLTFQPGKIIVCPLKMVLFGWELNGTEWRPTSHTISTLASAERPTTVKGLRGFLGAFKQYADCVEGYAEILHELESVVGSRAAIERINWTDNLKEVFESAKQAAGDITGVHIPKPSDTLQTYSDYSADTRAVGGRMVIVREENGVVRHLHGGYFSVILDRFKSHWVPCEAEAAGIRLTLQHFAAFIRESRNITTHYTDNMPSVQAWRRCLQGQFSASSRISTFLVNLSALSVELVYKPGKTLHSADYASRHPQSCPETSSCQICGFARKWQVLGDESAQLKTITVSDVLEGRTIMPLIQRKAWIGAQLNCPVHSQFRKLVQNGQHPDKKKTRGDHTLMKRLYNLYQAGDLVIQSDGLIMVKSRDGHFPGGLTISVPHHLMSGISFSLHIKLGHPSKGQLTSLMARYFYCTGGVNIIHSVVENCVQCRSVSQVPKEFAEDLTEKVEAFGTHFSIDIIERKSQKIFLAREKLSQYTWLELVPDQTAVSLRAAIIKTLLPWTHSGGAVVRSDGAKALESIAMEATRDGSVFKEYGISFDIGRPHNVNKNPIAENAIRECEREILRHKPEKNMLSKEDLAIVAKRMNERIRDRGVAAKEILTRRDLVLNVPKNIQDKDLGQDQFEKRLTRNHQTKSRRGEQANKYDVAFHTGDVIFIRNQLSKHQPREQFIVIGFKKDMIQVQKLHSKFGSKIYEVYKHEIMPANKNQDEMFEKVKEVQADYENNIQDVDTSSSEATEDREILEDPIVPEPAPVPEKPIKRSRGRPRKKILKQDGVPATNRHRRDAAVRASEKIRQDALATLSQNNNDTSRFYKPGILPPDPEEEAFETVMVPVDISKYWFYPPPVNYQFMEEVDWEFPAWEDWLRDNPVELEDRAVEPQEQNDQVRLLHQDPADEQDQAVRQDPPGPAEPEVPDSSSSEEFREAREIQEDEEFREARETQEDEEFEEEVRDEIEKIENERRARRPQAPEQVNIAAAADLTEAFANIAVPPEIEPEPEQQRSRSRSSSRHIKLPGRFDDFVM